MTINGPAPMILALFMNAAIDQQVERHLRESGGWDAAERRSPRCSSAASGRATAASCRRGNDGLGLGLLGVTGDQVVDAETYERIKRRDARAVRGTVQADILKEDQAQNTCIFSTEFALRMMGDVQQYFIDNERAQLLLGLDLRLPHRRGGREPDLAARVHAGERLHDRRVLPGARHEDRRLRAEPVVLLLERHGSRVRGDRPRRAAHLGARDARALRRRRRAARCSSTTSRRRAASLHAREIQFNDIRTTLQALYALFDNCNSLHTNAYDEAITTPTEESVRRAVAIQLIINRELGLNKNENPLAGLVRRSSELTDLVEEAVYASSSASPSAAACSARWRRCTSAARSRKRASTTSTPSTTARCRSSASTRSSPEQGERRDPRRRADPLDGRGEGRRRSPPCAPSSARNAARAPGGARAAAGGRRVRRQRLRGAHGGGQGRLARPDLARALPGRRQYRRNMSTGSLRPSR